MGQFHRLAHQVTIHIIQHDAFDAQIKGGDYIRQGAGFNFNFGRMTGLFLETRYMSFSPSARQGFPYSKANVVPIILGIQF